MQHPDCDRNGKTLCSYDCEGCFLKSFASCESSALWSSQNEGTPRDIFKGCNKKCIFDCDDCGHTFDRTPNSMKNSEHGCPYCSKFSSRLCMDENCDHCFYRSFACSDKAEFWSPKNTKDPREMHEASGIKCIFNCGDCHHEFKMQLRDVKMGHWCPYCASTKLCHNKNCMHCFERSFASCEF